MKTKYKRLKTILTLKVQKLNLAFLMANLGEFSIFNGFLNLNNFLLFDFLNLNNFWLYGFFNQFITIILLTSPF